MEKGYVHVYTGNGKGKTTSAIGLMIRAVGAGKKVYFGQFMKSGDYSEIKMLAERFPEITIDQYGGGLILKRGANANDKEIAQAGFEKASKEIMSQKFDLVILDEINVACFLNLIEKSDLLNLIDQKPENLELILTGRYADKEVIEKADLVSEIMQVKHYYTEGVQARKGIEM